MLFKSEIGLVVKVYCKIQVTTKINFKRNKLNMQRKERTCNELKPQMAEKEWKTKIGKKNKDNK